MPRITITISDELDSVLEDKSGEGGEFDSKSEVMRHLAERGRDADRLEREVDLLENRLDDLRRQMVERENVEEKVDTLAKRVEEREQAASAPFPVRWLRWWRSRGSTDQSVA